MITKLSLRNFKAFQAADVDLGRFTVLVGPNGSGKSSILQALHYCARLASGAATPLDCFSDERRPALFARHQADAGPQAISLAATLIANPPRDGGEKSEKPQAHFSLEMKPPLNGEETEIGLGQWTSHLELEWQGQELSEDAGNGRLYTLENPELRFIRPAALLRLEGSKLSAPSRDIGEHPQIGSDGEGLAAALANMRLSQPEEFESLQNALRAVLPEVARLRFERVPMPAARTPTRTVIGYQVVIDTKSGINIPGFAVSEGTLIVLGMLAVMYAPTRPWMLLIDDIDKALHPRAQRELIKQLRLLLDRHSQLQIVASTHSPYLLDELKYEEVRVTSILSDGTAACAPLEDHPEIDRWKEEMLPGEFWSVTGESWLEEWKNKAKKES